MASSFHRLQRFIVFVRQVLFEIIDQSRESLSAYGQHKLCYITKVDYLLYKYKEI